MVKKNNFWFTTHPAKHQVASGFVKNVDILIIGGGIAGVVLLNDLVNAGVFNTYLVEENTIGYGASGRASGQLMLRGSELFSKMNPSDGADYFDFIRSNSKRISNFYQKSNFDFDYNKSGGLRLAISDEEFSDLEKESEFLKKLTGNSYPIFDKKETQSIIPSKSFQGAMFCNDEAIFNPYKLTNSLRDTSERKGNRVLTGHQVESIDQNADGTFSVVIRHKGKIRAKKVVVCTNAFSKDLLPQLSDIITPFRGQMICTDVLPDEILNQIPAFNMTTNNCSEYFRLYNSRLIAGGMRESVRGNQLDIVYGNETSPAVYDKLRSFIFSSFPEVKDVPIKYSWSGIMCATPDGLPMIGKMPNIENLYLNIGFNGYGFSQAFAASLIVCDYIINEQSTRPGATLFKPSRFLGDPNV